ncbi:hypothetical protein H632_c1775p0, partial [Helicosporidium sp. ATCC 50920]
PAAALRAPARVVLAGELWDAGPLRVGRMERDWPGALRYGRPLLPLDATKLGRGRDVVKGWSGPMLAAAVELALATHAEVAAAPLSSALGGVLAQLRAAHLGRETVQAWPAEAAVSAPFWECAQRPECGQRTFAAPEILRRRLACLPSLRVKPFELDQAAQRRRAKA